MRFLILTFIITLAGCIPKQEILHRCSVFRDVGGKSVPLGLIQLPQELSDSLMLQLPKDARSEYVCWYTAGDNLVVSGRKTDRVITGRTFIKDNGAWKLSDYPPEILAVPGRSE